ncbi:MAG: hypothetical protein CMJ65_06805 [Planctomycetaceae bacterium]|jgi:hypothetical protein|nr:hypothetical protein [Planctomycetaceae bacterium]MDP7276418.1 hypothetical protein [Planctomycetaceae bacterium]
MNDPGPPSEELSGGTWRAGWILSPRQDAVWFLALPVIGVAVAMGCHLWLPFVALAAVNLWVTIPHHCATWLRTYGCSEDWQRWKMQLLLGPIVLGGVVVLGHKVVPTTLLLMVTLWDHQHSVMQQHGFARIYDFKAGTGSRQTGRFDLLVNWTLYVHMVLTAPLFVQYWVRELFTWHVPITVEDIQSLQAVSWTVAGVVVGSYVVHLRNCLVRGEGVNPIKLLFLVSSFGMWYVTAWHTDSILVFGVAHRLMHGLQYIVIVRVFLHRKATDGGRDSSASPGLRLGGGGLGRFIAVHLLYAVVFQLLVGQPRPLLAMSFGVWEFNTVYEAIPELGIGRFTQETMYALFVVAMIDVVALVHYYFDSFIWKVNDRRVQEGL